MIAMILLALGPPRQDTLTLAQAQARARAARGEAVAIQAAVDQARARGRVAGEIPNPIVSLSHSESAPRGHAIVEQPLAWLLTRGSDRAAARAGLTSAEGDSLERMAALGREVRVAFYRALAGRESRALIDQEAAVADTVAALADARFRAGDISALERDQIALEASMSRQAVSLAREGERRARAGLIRAIGGAPESLTLVGALDDGLDRPLPDTSGTPGALPLVAVAVADSIMAQNQWRSTRRGRIPFPSLQAGAEWADPAEPGRTLVVVGVLMPLPLWNRGGGTEALAAAEARIAAARVAEARLEADQRLTTLRTHLIEARWRGLFSRDSVLPAAQALRRRTVQAYEAGEIGVLPVLDALRREREAGIALAQALVDYQTALAEWLELWGRDR